LPPASLKRACAYIESHLAERVSIEPRAFKQSQGTTPHEYIVDRRIAHARALLKETDTPLSEIALVSGFADQSHLARHFKRRVGVSPRAFRQSQRCDGALSSAPDDLQMRLP
jgi:AraC-like DNA-binding protein